MADERIGIIIEAINNASDTLKAVQKDLTSLDSAATQAGSAGLKTLNAGLKQIGDAATKAGAALSLSVTAPLVLLGKTMIDQLGQIEQYRVKLNTLTGSVEAGGKALADLVDFAQKTPFTLPQVVDAATQLKAYGFATADLVKTLTTLGDVAAGVGTDIGDLTYLYGTLRTQGRAFSRDILQFQSRGIPIIQALAEELGVSESSIRGLVEEGKIGFPEVQKAFENLTKEGSRFGGLMDQQSKTLLGVFSNLKDGLIKLFGAILGFTSTFEIIEGGPFDQLKTFAEEALVVLNNLVAKFQAMPIETRNLIVEIALIAAAIGPALLAFGALIGVVEATVAAFAALAGPAGIALAAIAALTAAVALGTIAFKSFFDGLADPAIEEANRQIQEETKAREEASQAAIDIEQKKYDDLYNEATAGGANLTAQEKADYEDRLQQQSDAILAAKKADLDAKKAFIDAQIAHAKVLGGVYDVQNNRILSENQIFFKKLLRYAGSFGNSMVNVFLLLAKTVGSVVGNVFSSVGKAVSQVIDNAKNAVEALKSGDLAGAASAAAATVGDAFKSIFGGVGKDAAAGIASDFGKNFTTLMSQQEESLKQDMSPIVNEVFDYQGELDKLTNNANTDLANKLDGLENAYKTAGAGAAGATEKTSDLKKEISSLGKSLEDLGVFAIRENGKIVDTFDDAASGVDKLKKRIRDLGTAQDKALAEIADIGNTIQTALDPAFVANDVVDSFDKLEEKLKDVSSAVKDIIKDHQKFIDDAKKGIEEYATKVEEINKKFDEQRASAGEGAATDVATANQDALTREIELTKELADNKQKLIDANADLASGNGSVDAAVSAQEAVDKTTEELTKVRAEIDAFNSLNLENVTTELEKVQNALKSTTLSAKERTDLEQQELILLGKQNIVTEQKAALEQAVQDAKAKANLSDIDYTAYKLGVDLKAIEDKRNAELKALADVKAVQDAIVAGTVSTLDTTGLSQDAQDLAAKAITEQDTYRANLEAQQTILQDYKTKEAEIYANTYAELQAQQTSFQAFLEGSYDQIIAKLKQVEAAAKAALAAKQAAGGFQDGGFTGFAKGGYTGGGAKDQVAGVVHKGEWVAPKWMVQANRSLFAMLENARVGRMSGFEAGGFTAPATPTYNQPITMHNNISSQLDMNSAARYLAWRLRTG